MSGEPVRLVRIGLIVRAHGIRGEVTVRTDEPGSRTLLGQRTLYLRGDGVPVHTRAVVAARASSDAILLTLEGVAGRDQAEGLRGLEVLLPREVLPPAEADEFYVADLVGLTAFRPDGEELGKVERVLDTGAVPILEIRGKREWQAPLADEFVKQIDIAAGRIIVEPAEEEGALEA